QQARKRSCGIRELRLRRPFGASRRTDDETGRREDSKKATSSLSARAAIWTQHFSPGLMTQSSPNAGRHRQRAANFHRKKGRRQLRCCAHRFSGSDWHFLRARNSSPHWGLVGAMLSVWAEILIRSRRRARTNDASGRHGYRRTVPTPLRWNAGCNFLCNPEAGLGALLVLIAGDAAHSHYARDFAVGHDRADTRRV